MAIPCNRSNCLCKHEEPCAAGWISFRYKTVTEKKTRDGAVVSIENWYDGVQPCPTCDPERAHIFATADGDADLQERLKARSNLSRTKIQEDYEASRTRTL